MPGNYSRRRNKSKPCEMQQGCFKVRWCNGNIADCLSDVMSSILIRTARMLSLAYQVKRCIVNAKNRVRFPEATNTVWCNGNIITPLSF